MEKNNKSGAINKAGKIVIPFQYENISMFINSISIALKGKTRVLLTMDGRELTKRPYEYLGFCGKLFFATLNGKTGIIDAKENIRVPFIYDDLRIFGDGIMATSAKKIGYIDSTGKILIPIKYDWLGPLSSNIARAKLDGRLMYVKGSKEIVPPYDSFENFEGVYALISKNEKWGMIDQNFKEVIPPSYSSLKDFHEHLASAQRDNKYGYLDTLGNIAIPFLYDLTEQFSEGFAPVSKDGKWGLINSRGKLVLNYQYEHIRPFKNGDAIFKQNGKYGVINKDFKIIAEAKYQDVRNFYDGIFEVAYQNWIGYIDSLGNEYWD